MLQANRNHSAQVRKNKVIVNAIPLKIPITLYHKTFIYFLNHHQSPIGPIFVLLDLCSKIMVLLFIKF